MSWAGALGSEPTHSCGVQTRPTVSGLGGTAPPLSAGTGARRTGDIDPSPSCASCLCMTSAIETHWALVSPSAGTASDSL